MGDKLPIEVLTKAEFTSLVGVCGRRSPTGLRNRAMLTTMYRALLRAGEALALRPKDVNLDEGLIRVLHGKGDKPRTVAVGEGTLAIIQVWMDRRAQYGFTPSTPLFCTLSGKPLNQTYLRQLLPRLAAKCGIEKRCHAHGLRHSGAAQMAKDGFPMNEIQRMLGHANLATTSNYLDHVLPEDLVARVRAWDE